MNEVASICYVNYNLHSLSVFFENAF